MDGVTNRGPWVESCIRAMGDELGGLYGLLCKEFWELHRERDTYAALFQAASQGALLNDAAPDFFGLVQTLLVIVPLD